MAFAIRHPGQVAPFIRLAFTNDLTLAFLPARYFNVVHANSVFTHCPIEIIEECFAHVGRLMAPGAIFDFTFYRTNDAEYQVHHEDLYYQAETLIRLAAKHGLSARLMDDWLDPWYKQPKIRDNTRRVSSNGPILSAEDASDTPGWRADETRIYDCAAVVAGWRPRRGRRDNRLIEAVQLPPVWYTDHGRARNARSR